MFLKGIKRRDIEDIIEYIKWDRYIFSQKPKEECRNKQEDLDRMDNILDKLREAIL